MGNGEEGNGIELEVSGKGVATLAAFALVTETVGDAFLITGSLKCTLRDRPELLLVDRPGVGMPFVDKGGRGVSCMAGKDTSTTWRTTTSAARGGGREERV